MCECVYVYNILKKLKYMCMFIRLVNESVWACAPNFLALTVSPELLLSICVYISLSSFVWFSVCVAMRVYVCILSAPYQISTLTDSQCM